MKRVALYLLTAVIAIGTFTPQPAAAQTKLSITSMSPAGTNNAKLFIDIADRLTKASNGTLIVEPRDGVTLANLSNIYQRVLDDVVQIGWAVIPVFESTFPLSTVGALPLVSNSAPDGSVAAWRLYKSGALDSDFKDVVPLSMMVHIPYQIHMVKAPRSVTDLDGFKIVASSKTNADVTKALNGSAISLEPGEMYEAMQRGLAGGAVISWSSFQPYKLAEVTNYHLEGPFGTTVSMLFLSKAKYNSLPPQARQAIDTVGGEKLSREFGEHLKSQGDLSRGPVASSDKHVIKTMSAAEIQSLDPKLKPIVDEWANARPGRPEVLARFRSLYADVIAGR